MHSLSGRREKWWMGHITWSSPEHPTSLSLPRFVLVGSRKIYAAFVTAGRSGKLAKNVEARWAVASNLVNFLASSAAFWASWESEGAVAAALCASRMSAETRAAALIQLPSSDQVPESNLPQSMHRYPSRLSACDKAHTFKLCKHLIIAVDWPGASLCDDLVAFLQYSNVTIPSHIRLIVK